MPEISINTMIVAIQAVAAAASAWRCSTKACCAAPFKPHAHHGLTARG